LSKNRFFRLAARLRYNVGPVRCIEPDSIKYEP
jgi:hypothetical protein